MYRVFGTLAVMESKSKRLLNLAEKQRIIRSKDVYGLGIPRNYLNRLVEKGLLRKVGWGLYTFPSSSATEYLSLIEAACKVPNGVICLLSALQFHKFTTQTPNQVWMTIGVKAWKPRLTSSAVRFVRMSGAALHFGVEEHPIQGRTLKVYTPAKTVADCFKFRNKIGLDVALEALRESRRLKKASMDELWAAAKTCRVANVMRPYLESL
jgi:predicted transcriptional regulator of viral defense system